MAKITSSIASYKDSLIVCIVVCENDINKINLIKNTWFKLGATDYKYYFIIDDIYDFGKDESFIYINNLNLDTHFNIFRYFYSFNYDFIYISYLDSFLNINNLIKFLNSLDSTKKLYIGGHGDYRTINDNKYYFHSHSPGIVLTKPATNLLLDENLMVNYNIECSNNGLINLSGVALGYYATIYNFQLINNPNFYYCNWKGEPCHPNKTNITNLICCFNMDEQNMIEYYNYILNHKPQNFTDQTLVICPGGGLGNVLFQYFAGYSLSKQYNCKVYYQKNYNYWRGDMNKYRMFQHLDFINIEDINQQNFSDYNEKDFFYNPIKLENKNYKIFGYYQSFKYSEKYIDQIKFDLFYNLSTLYFNIEKKYFEMKNSKETCLIHVRRGDYLQYHNVHPICKDEYYIKGIQAIPDCKYLVFSDDINFIKNWSVFKNQDYEIVDLIDPEETLILMSMCDNFIIANSTLSLVAYLLRNNKNAKLVGPKIWFGDAGYKYKIEDIIPSNAILI
uniref:Glycosyltransferase n=1 Tax=viral metagenome TaxID=1070528 RepID=A0A6C0D9J6_9ZZZZ